MPSKPPTAHPDEKKLQIVFGIAIAAVVIGVLVFIVLVIKDMQH